jgi:hypothetical protein
MRNVCTILVLILLAATLGAQEQRKAVVLGIDALDKRLMDEWMQEGRLPNLRKLADSGHYSALETTDRRRARHPGVTDHSIEVLPVR